MDSDEKLYKKYMYDENTELTQYAKKKLKTSEFFDAAHVSTTKSLDDSEYPNDSSQNVSECLISSSYVGEFNSTCSDKLQEEAESCNIPKFPDASDRCFSPSTENVQEGMFSPIYKSSVSVQNVRLDKNDDEVLHELDLSIRELSVDNASEKNSKSVVDELFSSEEDLLNALEKENNSPNSIYELKNKEGFLESISLNIDKSPGELLLMALKFSLANQLSFTGITDLLHLINLICGDRIVPDTRYMIDKLLNHNDNIVLHSVCPACFNYLGVFNEKNVNITCENCETEVKVSNPSDPSYFALIDPSDAITDYLHNYENEYIYVTRNRIHQSGHIKDIYDGKAYRKFIQSLSDDDRYSYVTATLNTDGAPVFKSSNYSIWPIYIMINEIPVQVRFNGLIVIGLWFGKSKPEMTIILYHLVEFINELSVIGIPCKIQEQNCRIKLFIIMAVADTIARAPMNGTVQFNGAFGCDWCEHPGQYFQGSMRYPFLMEPAPERTEENMIKYAQEALAQSRPVRGVKRPSALLNLKKFDIITSFTPDYMHCLLAGVACQITEYMLAMLSKDDIDILESMLNALKVPHQIGRLTRGIKDRTYWKCREWENWALYYSLPLLDVVIKDKKYLKHWCLFVDSLHICLQTDITYEDLNRVNDMLNAFVSETEELYSKKALTYNVHQMLHIVKSIENWGPLWTHSTFAFESANRKLLRSIKCAKGVLLQIIRYTNIERFVHILEQAIYPSCSQIVIQYNEKICSRRAKIIFKLSSITYFGKERTIDECFVHNFHLSPATRVLSKIVFKGCLYTSSNKINKRSCNYFAQLTDNRFIKIINFLVDTDNSELTACQVLKVRSHKYSNIIKEIIRIYDDIIVVPTENIHVICVLLESDNYTYISPIPNLYHY